MNDKRWITWRGRRILVNANGNIVKSNYSLQKPITRKDVIKDIYKGGDGYWNIDLKDNYLSPDGQNYVYARTKAEAYDIVDSMVNDYNSSNKYNNINVERNKETKQDNVAKRLYEVNSWGNKEFIGYEYKNYKIKAQHEYSLRAFGYEGKMWYTTYLKNGKKIGTDVLKEMKQYIDDDINNKEF